ncbi:glycosyltransferase, partial [Neisseria sp. P0022.S002]|uniref:glycosyltransferase n=1 Tax=Neisseria sp. P0022.S002 TaxID=3436827 RepID=UPI003F7D2696
MCMIAGGYPFAALQASFLTRTEWNHPTCLHTTPYFNSGMLLVDLAQWREHNIAAQLLQTTTTIDKSVPYGDQCFLNTVFQKNWLQLEESWNFQTCAVQYVQKRNLGEIVPKPGTVPPVIHYTTRAKPWLCDYGKIPF